MRAVADTDVDAIDWLLASDEPAIRYRTLTDLMDRSENDPAVTVARAAIPQGPKVRALLSGLEPDGRFGVEPYRKWTGGHWRLVSLAGLRVLADVDLIGDERASEALDIVESKRRPDGRWVVDGAWWKSVGGHGYPEAVNWGRSGPNEMVTFHALRVLQVAGQAT